MKSKSMDNQNKVKNRRKNTEKTNNTVLLLLYAKTKEKHIKQDYKKDKLSTAKNLMESLHFGR